MFHRSTHCGGRRGYHHGALRETLIAAARDLIAEVGPLGFTLNEAARRAGVSAAAPYRHFRDRDALLAAVAEEGWAAFADALKRAWGEGGAAPAPVERFKGMGRAYLAFARAEPGYYAAMFAAGPPGEAPGAGTATPAAMSKPSFTAFDLLQRGLAAFGPEGPVPEEPCPETPDAATAARLDLGYRVWALSHGIASLASARLLPPDASAETLLDAGVEALVRAGR